MCSGGEDRREGKAGQSRAVLAHLSACARPGCWEWPTVGVEQEFGGDMNELVYAGDCPSAVGTDCMWKRQCEGLTSSSTAEACPGSLGVGLGDCVCVYLNFVCI